ncbi:MAG: ABC transporter ATP-binding protein [Firmicutes bacterium]|nr:ABC transporter ATP-binding protein [Bacillota bacterium]
MNDDRPVIKMDNIVKKYGSHEVLKGVSLTVNKGDIYGLIGKNGAGKTTIFKILLGLSESSGGEISILGSSTPKEHERSRKNIGFFVGHSFYPYLTSVENLRYFATVKGIPAKEQKKEIDRVLEIVDLKGVKKPASKFSLGMKQRLGIANAILGNPEILILDEPTNGLDPQGIADIRHMVRRCNEEFGMTVIVSSHILGELEHTAERFGIVNEGIVVSEITQDDLKEKEKVIEIAVDDLEKAKQLLADGGVKVLREVQEKSSLEDFYFRLIGGGGK